MCNAIGCTALSRNAQFQWLVLTKWQYHDAPYTLFLHCGQNAMHWKRVHCSSSSNNVRLCSLLQTLVQTSSPRLTSSALYLVPDQWSVDQCLDFLFLIFSWFLIFSSALYLVPDQWLDFTQTRLLIIIRFDQIRRLSEYSKSRRIGETRHGKVACLVYNVCTYFCNTAITAPAALLLLLRH